jgi:general secretion pathway protein D
MKPRSRLRALLCIAALAALAGCAAQRLHEDGMRLVSEGKHDAAISALGEAQRRDPNNSEYRIDLVNEQAAYSNELMHQGDAARAAGRPEEAAAFYRKAKQVLPANERAARAIEQLDVDARTAALVAASEKLAHDGSLDLARDKVRAALQINAHDPAALRQNAFLQEQFDHQREVRAAQVAAHSVMARPVTLQFRDANLRMVFEALSRTTGLNVILDRDVRADLKTTIFVKDASVEDTVDLILLQNQLEKRVLNANTMFVYPATTAKQKEYQDLQVRTFQVLNADVKNLQTVLKTVLKVKEVSIDERSGTLVLRDTPDAIAVASKIIAAHDTPEPEVMLEVAVLEVSHTRLSDLGVEFPNQFTISTPPGAQTLYQMRQLHLGDLLGSPLSANINFRLEDSDANLLASPRIRARNKEKAKILIGDRVPIITNTVTPVSTGAGVVTGSVQYQDVGLKLEFEPTVYSEDEVGIKISLEVSNIAKEISGPNGSLAYQIGTRNAQTVVRLRDGENQILGGLISSEDRNTNAKVPGLGHLPVVGRLFGNNSGSVTKTEIVLSITPRILRAPAAVDSSLREVYSGTEASIRQRALQLDPVGTVRVQSTTGSPTAPAAPAAPIGTPTSVPPAVPPAAAPAIHPQPVVAPPPSPAPAATPTSLPAMAPSPAPPIVPTSATADSPAPAPVVLTAPPTPAAPVAPAAAAPAAPPGPMSPAAAAAGATPPPGTVQYMRALLPYLNNSRYPKPQQQPAAEAAPAPEAPASAPAPEAAASGAKGSS